MYGRMNPFCTRLIFSWSMDKTFLLNMWQIGTIHQSALAIAINSPVLQPHKSAAVVSLNSDVVLKSSVSQSLLSFRLLLCRS